MIQQKTPLVSPHSLVMKGTRSWWAVIATLHPLPLIPFFVCFVDGVFVSTQEIPHIGSHVGCMFPPYFEERSIGISDLHVVLEIHAGQRGYIDRKSVV